MSCKNLLLVRSKILSLFVNTLTADGKYSRHNWKISSNKFKRNYLKNEKLNLDFSLRSWNLHQILSILKKKDESHSLSISEIIDSERGGY